MECLQDAAYNFLNLKPQSQCLRFYVYRLYQAGHPLYLTLLTTFAPLFFSFSSFQYWISQNWFFIFKNSSWIPFSCRLVPVIAHDNFPMDNSSQLFIELPFSYLYSSHKASKWRVGTESQFHPYSYLSAQYPIFFGVIGQIWFNSMLLPR